MLAHQCDYKEKEYMIRGSFIASLTDATLSNYK